jgi:hypothetical protein
MYIKLFHRAQNTLCAAVRREESKWGGRETGEEAVMELRGRR